MNSNISSDNTVNEFLNEAIHYVKSLLLLDDGMDQILLQKMIEIEEAMLQDQTDDIIMEDPILISSSSTQSSTSHSDYLGVSINRENF